MGVWWTWGESNPRPGNANAMHYHYATGPCFAKAMQGKPCEEKRL